MLNFGCIPVPFNPSTPGRLGMNYDLFDKLLLLLERHGIPQGASIFCFVFITMVAIKTFTLQKAKWGSALRCFNWMSMTTMVSLATGLGLYGLSGMKDPVTLAGFTAATVALDALVVRAGRRKMSVPVSWFAGVAASGLAVSWMTWLNVPYLFVSKWPITPGPWIY